MANVTFPFPFPANMEILLPEIIIAVMAMVILLFDLFVSKEKKQISAWLAIATCIAAAITTVNVTGSESMMTFYGFFVQDYFAAFTKLLMLAATVFGIILSLDYMKEETNIGEYYALMLFALLGMMLMVSATNFITMYLGVELMALSVYVLVGYQRDVLRSSEAALKYFILGSLSSGMLLYGISFLYGTTGNFDFNLIGEALANSGDSARTATLVGMLFVLAGMAFKVSVAPFHMWTPDAYEGAPTPVTAFMSVGPKVAGFAILMRILVDAMPALEHDYVTVLLWMAVLSLAVGNIAAIAQRNIKRMMAYSTIGHVGFVLLGLIAASPEGYAAILIYMTIYLFMTMGTFAIIILMRRDGIQGELLDDFAGMSKVRPGYALAMGLMMFSLAGIPFLGGFWAKFAVIAAVIDAGHLYLGLAAIMFSAIGAFYYIRVVKYIYFDEERVAFNFSDNVLMKATVALTSIIIVVIGVYPDPVMDVCRMALAGLV